MNDKVKIIDKALKATVKRYYSDVKSDYQKTNLYIQLLCSVVEGNFECITSFDGSRNIMKKLGTSVIKLELMKNIIKVNSHYHEDKKYVPLKTNKTLDNTDLTVEEVEFLVYKAILKSNSEIVFSKMLNNYKVLLGSIISFVDSRYSEKNKIVGLDFIKDYNDLTLKFEINQAQDKLMLKNN